MKKRTSKLLSLLLTLAMVLGMLPAMSITAMAAEPGRTEDNPVVCKTFDEFKEAMEGSAAFVKLAGGYFEATVTGDSIKNAVYTNGNKTLIVEGYNKFVPAADDRYQINSLIAVGLNNNLTIQGTGQIEYWHENSLEAGAVICLEATGANLTVNGEVTIKGYHDGSNVHGRAIYATTGTVTINGGKFVGDDARNEGYTAESSVVTIKGDASLKVNGGTFMTGGSTQCDHGVYINTTGDVQLRAGTFQNNGITIDKNVTIAGSGYFTGATIKAASGVDTPTELSDWNQNVSVLKGKTVVLEYPYFIRDISATVTKPADGASPVFSATAGDDNYTVTVDKWYDGGTAESPNTLGAMNASGTFVAGNSYVVGVTFTPKEGYVILPGYSAAINGVDAVLAGSNTGTGAVYYRVAFTATEKKYSGTGSYNDPAVCTNFEAFKQAMENPSIQYVKLVGDSTPGFYKKDTIPVNEDGVLRDAVLCDGRNKVLILEGNTQFEGPPTCNSLINLSVNNRLTITGNGTLAYCPHYFHRESAVVNLEGDSAKLTVEDGVRLRGFAEVGNTHGRAIYAKSNSTVIINGGILYGEDALTTNADEIFTSAVTITGHANLIVNGGYISTTREEDKQCESALYLDTTGQVILREGEILEAGIVVVPNTLTINGSAYFAGSRVYTKSGSEWIESDRMQPVSILEGTNVKMSFTQFIDAATVKVTDPMSGQAPNATSFTVGDSTYTVDKITWYNGGTVDNPGTKMTSSDTFEAGQTYIVDVRVKPTSGSGYVIQNGCTVTINGVSTDKAFYRDGINGAGNYRVALTAQPSVLTGRVQFTSAANPGKTIGMVLVDGTVKDVNSTALNYQWQIEVDGTWLNVGTDRYYSPAAADLGRQIRVIVTADGYEGSIVSDALTIAKAFNPASPSKPPVLVAVMDGEGQYTTMQVSTKPGQDYVWRESENPESNLKAIDWTENAFAPGDDDYVNITGLEVGKTYYVYTRISETESTQAGVGVKYSSLLLKTPDFLQKVVLEGYTDYGDGNTIYIPVGETVNINVGKYPADASTWSYFTFGDPSFSTYIYEVTDPTGQVQETMPTRITLKGNNVGTGTLKAYYNGGMYDYGSWRVIVYDTLQAGQVTFTDKPAYDDISLYVGDSYTPTAPASGLLLPTEAKDEFEYKWYLYEGTDSISGSPYGTTTNNGYLSIDPETGKVTALSANRTGTHQPYVKLCLVDKEDTSKYQVVTEYKVTVASNGEVPITSVVAAPKNVELLPGGSVKLVATVNPTNTTESGTITWTKNEDGSDNITMDGTGKVTVSGSAEVGETATFTATCGSFSDSCTVTVVAATEPEHDVNVTNGTATVNEVEITKATVGDKVVLTASSAPSGKVFYKWEVVTGNDVILENASKSETYFYMPNEDVAVKATYKDKIVLTDLSATVDAPVAGAMPDLTATAGGYGYTAKVEWWIKEGEVWTQVDDKPFVAGQEYSIYIEFYAADGFAFASEEALTATINGEEAIYTGYLGDHLVSYSIWVTVPATIANANVTVAAPVKDGTPADAATADTQYTVANTSWEPVPGSTFAASTVYSVVVTLEAKEGYQFTDSTAFKVNGNSATVVTQSAEEAKISYTFPATASSGGSSSGGGSGVSTYAITVDSTKNGDVTSSHKSAAKGTTITLTVNPDKGYTLETITVTDGSGKEVKLTEKNGKYTFTMPASKVTVKATFMEDNSMLNFFVDVPADAYYYDAVLWAAENGITGGVDDTHFAPNATCTRAQAVTFLWRAAGSPAPKSSEMPFTDVAAGSYYETAVLWAVENGITKGTSDTTFTPNAKCTRAQIVTFLWRSQKSPASDSVNPFTDVAADAYYNTAVLWAAENGITGGTSATTFSPNNDCTRAQIVTFLFRCLGK